METRGSPRSAELRVGYCNQSDFIFFLFSDIFKENLTFLESAAFEIDSLFSVYCVLARTECGTKAQQSTSIKMVPNVKIKFRKLNSFKLYLVVFGVFYFTAEFIECIQKKHVQFFFTISPQSERVLKDSSIATKGSSCQRKDLKRSHQNSSFQSDFFTAA